MIIKTEKQLQKIVCKLRVSGIRTIAAVVGTFRFVHPGHVYLFMKAYNKVVQKNGVVVVLINSLDSIKRIKPNADFVMDDASRLVMIDLLPCVHYVYMFNDDTPERVCNLIRPDYLFKGSDWRGKVLPEAKYCGKTVFINRVDRDNPIALGKKIEDLRPLWKR